MSGKPPPPQKKIQANQQPGFLTYFMDIPEINSYELTCLALGISVTLFYNQSYLTKWQPPPVIVSFWTIYSLFVHPRHALEYQVCCFLCSPNGQWFN